MPRACAEHRVNCGRSTSVRETVPACPVDRPGGISQADPPYPQSVPACHDATAPSDRQRGVASGISHQPLRAVNHLLDSLGKASFAPGPKRAHGRVGSGHERHQRLPIPSQLGPSDCRRMSSQVENGSSDCLGRGSSREGQTEGVPG